MNEKDFIFSKDIELDGIVKWTAPSNIAIVKYWGKLENQIPQNPSISLTLNESITTTSLSLKPKSNNNSNLKFEFEGETNKAFEDKTRAFFKKIDKYFPFILNHDIEIKSKNNFPHSSGIASSASSMAVLSACLVDFEKMNNSEMSDDFFYKKASFISRIGSGSASRSICGPVVIWGESEAYENSNDLYAVNISNQTHEIDLKNILKSGDLDGFISIAESEALMIHSLMLTSNPSYILMKPNTLKVISKITEYRSESKLPICFTLDAGSNVHLLYPNNIKDKISDFINNELIKYCSSNKYIEDKVGSGPEKIN